LIGIKTETAHNKPSQTLLLYREKVVVNNPLITHSFFLQLRWTIFGTGLDLQKKGIGSPDQWPIIAVSMKL